MRPLVCTIALALSVCSMQAAPFTLEQALSYPYAGGTASAPSGGHVAWVRNVAGVRNVWVADAPSRRYVARQVTKYTADDGQEIGELMFSPDARNTTSSMCAAAITTPTGKPTARPFRMPRPSKPK